MHSSASISSEKKKIFKELKGVYLQKISKHEKTGKIFSPDISDEIFSYMIKMLNISKFANKTLEFL